VGTNEKKTWDLGLSAALRMAHHPQYFQFHAGRKSGTTNFEMTLDTAGMDFKYDESTGNLDSTAIGNWLEFLPPDSTKSYSQEVYVIDRGYDGSETFADCGRSSF